MNDDRPTPHNPEYKKPAAAPGLSGDAGSVGGGRMMPHQRQQQPVVQGAPHPVMHMQRQQHKITLITDEMLRIKMGDTERHISGE